MELDSVPSVHTVKKVPAGPGTCYLKVMGPMAFIKSIIDRPTELDEFGEPVPLGRVRLLNHALKVLYATAGEVDATDSLEESDSSDSEASDD